ncbi:MAG: MlaC/ttg2D family ABC transporter substrate-binding protein [Candidatus Methylomirabilia bacterium]
MAKFPCSRRLLKKAHLRRGPCIWTFLSSLLVCGFMFLGPVSHAVAATPLEVVKSTNEAVLAIYARHKKVDAAVEKEIFTVIDAVTDYEALAGGAIDPLCPKLTAAQCTSFKEIFTRLLRVSSVKKLGRARAGRFEYRGEKVTGKSAVVRSTAFFNEESVPLDYYLERRGGTWVIVNYFVDEVDTVTNYRKQFRSLLAKKTFEQVMNQLEHKIAALEAEK